MMNIWVSYFNCSQLNGREGGEGGSDPTAVTCSVKACNHKKFIQDNNISVKFKNNLEQAEI